MIIIRKDCVSILLRASIGRRGLVVRASDSPTKTTSIAAVGAGMRRRIAAHLERTRWLDAPQLVLDWARTCGAANVRRFVVRVCSRQGSADEASHFLTSKAA